MAEIDLWLENENDMTTLKDSPHRGAVGKALCRR